MYIKFLPSQYVLRYKNGRLIKEGTGLSFFFLARNTAVCAVPVTSTDADFIFEEITADFQKVSVQGQLTYRISDCKKAADSVDFSVDLRTKRYNDSPMTKLSKRIINIAGVVLKDLAGKMSMTDLIGASREIAENVLAEMRESPELRETGISVTGFSVIKISADPETSRALEAGTREEILRQSDDALYVRRNASIEQERKVKENELNTERSIEEKKRLIRESQIGTERMTVEKKNEIERIRIESQTERERIKLDAEIELEQKRKELLSLKSENARREADDEAYRIGAVMEAYGKLGTDVLISLAAMELDPEQLMARAVEKFAAASGKIGTLNIAPDLLGNLLMGRTAKTDRLPE